ncbi:uncharacterized protein LOC127798440 [Diospyros lotus]|uniref:uncharacterized protein LOC127798440 n=1 Tax=Diospyros lotus TaxID=55363 RepID=UPI0022550283|nr:uncharacterized protein LOC127798440 [Diospyros lotus]
MEKPAAAAALLVSMILSLLFFKEAGAALDPAIKKVCAATSNPEICETSVVPFLNGKTDPKSVLGMQINAGIRATQSAIMHAQKIKSSPATSQEVSGCVDVCLENYDLAVDSAKNALEALRSNKPFDLANHLSAVSSMVSTCDDAFNDFGPEVANSSPLSKIDTRLLKIASNGLSLQQSVFH